MQAPQTIDPNMAAQGSTLQFNQSSALRFRSTLVGLFLVAISVTACGGPDKKTAQQYLKKAEDQLAMRQYIAALEFLDKALAADPKNSRGRFLKSETFYNTARVDEAAKIMAKLYKETPNDTGVRIGLAHMRKDQGMYPEAIKLFESLPMEASFQLPIAECLTGIGRHNDAANMLGELLAANPWDPKAYLLYSRVETKRSREESAKLWGEFYRNNENLREGERQALRAEHEGNVPLALLTRGRNAYRSGLLFEGAAFLEAAIKAAPKIAPAYLTTGRILTDLGRSAEAIQAIETALSLKPDMPNWKARLTKAKEQLTQLQDRPRSVLEMAALYEAQSKPDLVRAVVLYEAHRDITNVAALRLVVKHFGSPEDAFIRVWAWRNAVIADPKSPGFLAGLKSESAKLGVDLKAPTGG
jgi:tetratricopeptide (TPR) repeat protein